MKPPIPPERKDFESDAAYVNAANEYPSVTNPIVTAPSPGICNGQPFFRFWQLYFLFSLHS